MVLFLLTEVLIARYDYFDIGTFSDSIEILCVLYEVNIMSEEPSPATEQVESLLRRRAYLPSASSIAKANFERYGESSVPHCISVRSSNMRENNAQFCQDVWPGLSRGRLDHLARES